MKEASTIPNKFLQDYGNFYRKMNSGGESRDALNTAYLGAGGGNVLKAIEVKCCTLFSLHPKDNTVLDRAGWTTKQSTWRLPQYRRGRPMRDGVREGSRG